MDEDVLNMTMRKFLKKVGVTSQRAIEEAVREGIESGKLADQSSVKARVVLTLESLDVTHTIDGDIEFK
ncbi:MAG TPA: DUF6494 family protein [Kiloniellales bacterium]|nr:DUF6494 family protein [Kiloniellales bacterium]